MQDRPTAAEVLVTIGEYLDEEVLPAVEGALRYKTLVAANLIKVLERELAAGDGPHHCHTAHVGSPQHAAAHEASSPAGAAARPLHCVPSRSAGKAAEMLAHDGAAPAAAAHALGPTSSAQCCQTWHEQLPAQTAAHAAGDAAPAGASSRPCTTVEEVLMGKSAADSGDEHSHGRSPRKKRQPSLKSTSVRAAPAAAQQSAQAASRWAAAGRGMAHTETREGRLRLGRKPRANDKSKQ